MPRRVYQRRGKFYYAHPDGEWIALGDDYGNALRKYADILGQRPIGSMSDLFDRYLLEIIPGKAPRTQRDQIKQLELLRIAFGHLKPADVSPRLVFRYRNAAGQRSQTQANQELALLKHICKCAVEWEILEFNPCREVSKFKLEQRDHYVDDRDYLAMRAAAGSRLQVFMDLALLTGQREGDLLALRWEQVEKEGIRFKQGKTGKTLIVGWSAELKRVIARARQIEPQGDAVVSTQDGQPYTVDGFQSLWRRARTRAKLKGLKQPFRFHDLRAKSASDDALLAASERLGHSSTALTDRVYMRAPRRVKPLDFGKRTVINRRQNGKSKKNSA